jgi:cell wall-associated NlpC family hydrolase
MGQRAPRPRSGAQAVRQKSFRLCCRAMRSRTKLSLLAVLLPLGACDRSTAAATVPESHPPSVQSPTSAQLVSTNAGESEDEPTANDERGDEGDETAIPAAPRRAIADNSPRAFVREIDRELGAMRTSSYTHTTAIDESSGAFNYDCSGFVGYALEGSAPSAFEELTAATVRRPLAKHFEAFFASLPSNSAPHWARVRQVSELQPGDIVAWLKVPGSASRNTGHVVTVHGTVTPESGHPGSYLVPIADSTSLRHGRTDSRYPTKTTGLGTGTLVLVADASGAPVAYRWSLARKSRELATTFAMARLTGR